jgi:2-hydroxy-3-keto-5-methylthiopentenyl-1-phosphate phosphatase
MGSHSLPYMKTNPKLIFFTDFDGTITVDDSRCFPAKRYFKADQNRQ